MQKLTSAVLPTFVAAVVPAAAQAATVTFGYADLFVSPTTIFTGATAVPINGSPTTGHSAARRNV